MNKNEAPMPTLAIQPVDILSIMQALGRMEAKIDKSLELDEVQTKITDDHETRLRTLERNGWKQLGIVIGGSTVVTLLLNFGHKLGIFPQ